MRKSICLPEYKSEQLFKIVLRYKKLLERRKYLLNTTTLQYLLQNHSKIHSDLLYSIVYKFCPFGVKFELISKSARLQSELTPQ